ncbi:DUF6111 family protein [Polycladidibacter stylochi]|uniref:DUF6111 family protein n=1 Tax=Polycladidibacter stylochi TaxID=1807766 RepID=UPI00082D1DD8|nr:DUF6111 family protein [Pseudovibrio stylochi]
MLRVILTNLLLFLIPFIAYGFWFWLTKKGQEDKKFREGPFGRLAILGLSLAVLSFVAMAILGDAPEGSQYVPAHMEDGRFIPGGFERTPD